MYVRMSGRAQPVPGTSLSGSLQQPPIAPPSRTVTLAMRRAFAVLDGFAFNGHHVRGPDNERKVAVVARHVVASWTGAQPVRTIRLVGHTDPTGTAEHNLRLGKWRAEAVGKKVVDAIERLQKGLRHRIDVVIDSAGETDPRESNRSLAGRLRNRRVEVFLSSDVAVPVRLVPAPSPPAPRPRPPSATEMRERAVRDRPETPSERAQRIIEEYSRSETVPGKPVGKAALDKLEAALAARGLPRWVRQLIISSVERGSKTLLEQVMTASGLGEQQKEAIRQAIREALRRSW